jgi:hypothetical protein
MILSKRSVYVIHLLALFDKYKNIIDDANFTSIIDFNQTMVRIYPNSSIDIIPIIFE